MPPPVNVLSNPFSRARIDKKIASALVHSVMFSERQSTSGMQSRYSFREILTR